MSNFFQIVSIVAVLKNKNGKFLLVQRSKNDDIFPMKWQNLGGKMEIGETVEDTIIREVKEEVNIDLLSDYNPIFLQSYSWKKDSKSPIRLGLIFLVNLDCDEDIVSISNELNDFGWFSFDDIVDLDSIGRDSNTGTMSQIKKAINFDL